MPYQHPDKDHKKCEICNTTLFDAVSRNQHCRKCGKNAQKFVEKLLSYSNKTKDKDANQQIEMDKFINQNTYREVETCHQHKDRNVACMQIENPGKNTQTIDQVKKTTDADVEATTGTKKGSFGNKGGINRIML